MDSAQFQDAIFIGVDLSGAKISRANFRGAVLWNTKLNDVDACRANFTGVDLNGVQLQNANLANAKLLGVNITHTEIWKSVLYDEKPVIRKPVFDSLGKIEEITKEVKSIGDLVNMCQGFKDCYKDDWQFYFRGEAFPLWELSPSVMRLDTFRHNENKMLVDLMSQRPENFIGATSALSQWVIAQHHGLETRLLDITRNPLVALFHACDSFSTPDGYKDDNGILHVFMVPKYLVKTFDSDTISVIANLAKLPRQEQDLLMGRKVGGLFGHLEKSPLRSLHGYHDIMERLYHYIGQEKSFFKEKIDIRELFCIFVVEPEQSFERIRAQSGAFLISAFHERFEREQILSRNGSIPVYDYYRIVVPAKKKPKILDELRLLNVTREVLFPSLGESARAISEKYGGT